MAEKARRSTEEVTAASLVDRLNSLQILEIINNDEFSELRPHILELLKTKNNLPYNLFMKVHDGCDIGHNWLGSRPSGAMDVDGYPAAPIHHLALHCATHEITSDTYVDFSFPDLPWHNEEEVRAKQQEMVNNKRN